MARQKEIEQTAEEQTACVSVKHELPKVGSVFWKHKKKYHVAAYTDDCTGKTPKDLMLVRRWNKYSQAWVYEVWEIDDYFMIYLDYIKFEKGGAS